MAGETIPGPVVVVAFDESSAGEAALAGALAVAQQAGWSTLHVVHVLGGPDPMSRIEYAYETHQLDLDKERQSLQRRISAFAAEHAAGAEPGLVLHVLVGPPAKEILRQAAALDADVIVVGTRGRKGLGRVVLGSVAEEVLRGADCSVLVMRAKSWRR